MNEYATFLRNIHKPKSTTTHWWIETHTILFFFSTNVPINQLAKFVAIDILMLIISDVKSHE